MITSVKHVPCHVCVTGTTAKVRFIMSGEDAETESRILWDDKRSVLQTSSVDSFVMAVPHPLGQLTHLRCVSGYWLESYVPHKHISMIV